MAKAPVVARTMMAAAKANRGVLFITIDPFAPVPVV
jgi:hypothetical protein